MKTLGQRIRELREEKDISLRELAKQLEVSPAFVSDIELGRRFPSNKVLANLANILNTTVEKLQQFDTRPPVEDLKRMATSNPLYGVAFRKVVDKNINPQDLIDFLNSKPKKNKK